MKKKNMKGITLIALVITIIVLLILASVSIFMIVGKNGILNRASDASKSTKEASIVEDLQMAWSSCYADYLSSGSSEDETLFFSPLKLNDYIQQGKIISVMSDGENKKLVYRTQNNDNFNYYEIKITPSDEFIIEAQNTETIKKDKYLVDEVEIGDYVYLGEELEYENDGHKFMGNNLTAQIYDNRGIKGWRVLSKSGSGVSGTVELVSAGDPLMFFPKVPHDDTMLSLLENLNQNFVQVESTEKGYSKSGFTGGTFNLKEIWNKSPMIVAETAHALSKDDIIKAYHAITGSDKNFDEWKDVGSSKCFNTSVMLESFPDMSVRAIDLLSNSTGYYISGDPNTLWGACMVGFEGSYSIIADHYSRGVRPAFSLKPGIKISSSNTGDGLSYETAYEITMD